MNILLNDVFEKFEDEVIKRIIAENPELSKTLKRQYSSSIILSRKFTGAGFYTEYEITDKSLLLPDKSNHLGKTQAKVDGLEYGMGFILYVKDGIISTLEGHTYGEAFWPKTIISYHLLDEI